MRVTIRVRPGSARTAVGGEYVGDLVLRVTAGLDGRATEAALDAVAAPGVRRREVTLISEATSRTKVVDVAGADQAVLDRLLDPLTSSTQTWPGAKVIRAPEGGVGGAVRAGRPGPAHGPGPPSRSTTAVPEPADSAYGGRTPYSRNRDVRTTCPG